MVDRQVLAARGQHQVDAVDGTAVEHRGSLLTDTHLVVVEDRELELGRHDEGGLGDLDQDLGELLRLTVVGDRVETTERTDLDTTVEAGLGQRLVERQAEVLDRADVDAIADLELVNVGVLGVLGRNVPEDEQDLLATTHRGSPLDCDELPELSGHLYYFIIMLR